MDDIVTTSQAFGHLHVSCQAKQPRSVGKIVCIAILKHYQKLF